MVITHYKSLVLTLLKMFLSWGIWVDKGVKTGTLIKCAIFFDFFAFIIRYDRPKLQLFKMWWGSHILKEGLVTRFRWLLNHEKQLPSVSGEKNHIFDFQAAILLGCRYRERKTATTDPKNWVGIKTVYGCTVYDLYDMICCKEISYHTMTKPNIMEESTKHPTTDKTLAVTDNKWIKPLIGILVKIKYNQSCCLVPTALDRYYDLKLIL